MLIIIPVHGTGDGSPRVATGEPAWWSPESYFALIMREALEGVHDHGKAHFAWSPFCWSGANVESARNKSARLLAKRLREDVRDHGEDAEFLIIAHSHGGNVVLDALVELYEKDIRDKEREERRSGKGLPRLLAALNDAVHWPEQKFKML